MNDLSPSFTIEATGLPADEGRIRFDRATIALHWATALLVVALFALAETWGIPARGSPLREGMRSVHVSLGLLLAAVLTVRIAWRTMAGRKLPATEPAWMELAAKGAHHGLYVLVVLTVGLGFFLRWSQHQPLSFFDLFAIPSPVELTKPQGRLIHEAHNLAAIATVVLAGAHAAAALFHHYVLRDGVLRRMLPGAARG